MRAVVFDRFGQHPEVRAVRDPRCPPDGVVIAVAATGLCRSDWHGWAGHDPDIALPHVPGHEFAGTIVDVGPSVSRWRAGQRVTTPFVCACGDCPPCRRGDQQVCDNQRQPGFTHWGSFAELVAVDRADLNLIAVPDDMAFSTAASLGCRFATAYRAVVEVGQVEAGDWVAVHGCGGVRLSAVMIAAAAGARVVAVDPAQASRHKALELGAEHAVDAASAAVADEIVELTGGGADLSLDALGHPSIIGNSLRCLRKRGRHVQVGLVDGARDWPALPIDLLIGAELRIYGSHGLSAASYPQLLERIAAGTLRPELLIRDRITLDETPSRLATLGDPGQAAGGITMIEPAGSSGAAWDESHHI